MTLKDIQFDVDKWTSQFSPQYWNPHEMLARLTEEVGELAREINHRYGPKQKKDSETKKQIGEELSDIMFTITCIANIHKISLTTEWNRMMEEKQYGRDNTRFKH